MLTLCNNARKERTNRKATVTLSHTVRWGLQPGRLSALLSAAQATATTNGGPQIASRCTWAQASRTQAEQHLRVFLLVYRKKALKGSP